MKSFALNKDLVRTIGTQLRFDTHFILQPVGGYRNRFTTNAFLDNPHYTSAVHRLIAEALYPIVVQSLGRPARR